MRLYTIEKSGAERVAIQGADGRLYTIDSLGFDFPDMNELIERASGSELDELRRISRDCPASAVSFPLEAVKFCAPIPVPRQDVICLGVNYEEHMQETAEIHSFKEKEATIYFSKRVSRAGGTGDPIPNYSFVDSLDYEAELGVILGRTVERGSAPDVSCIFGYTVFNDVSARDVQYRHKQWYFGKSLDGYTIMGPCIVTADEIENVQSLDIFCRVNGETRQRSNTRLMIQPVMGAIEELSRGITLRAGTIIATGTPGGVGLGMKPPKYLKSGDVVECEIEKIGVIVNKVGQQL